MTGVLVGAARRNIGPEAMQSVVAALRLSPAPNAVPDRRETVNTSGPGSGFLDKIYREADGSEVKYVVFVPPHYTGDKIRTGDPVLAWSGKARLRRPKSHRQRPGEGHPREERGLPVPRDLPASPRGRGLDARVHWRQTGPRDPEAACNPSIASPRTGSRSRAFPWAAKEPGVLLRPIRIVGRRSCRSATAGSQTWRRVSRTCPAGASMAMPMRSFPCRSRVRWSERSRRPVESRCIRSSSASITITLPTAHTPCRSCTNGCCSRIVPSGSRFMGNLSRWKGVARRGGKTGMLPACPNAVLRVHIHEVPQGIQERFRESEDGFEFRGGSLV